MDGLQLRTNRLWRFKTPGLKMMELWDYYNSLDVAFLYISLPELKVCIYFSLKRLIFNSGWGGEFFAVKIHCSEVF